MRILPRRTILLSTIVIALTLLVLSPAHSSQGKTSPQRYITLQRLPNTLTTNLYGRIVGPVGWGLASNTVTQPGPTLTVTSSDSVSLSLFSGDSITHRFCVDYNGNSVCDATEPLSASFVSPTTPTAFSFTATATQGTYTYFCTIHGLAMSGQFVVSAPDVAVGGIVASRIFAYAGVSSTPIQINVTANNLSTLSQTFFVSAKANNTLIGNQTVTVPGGQIIIVSFQWNTNAFTNSTFTLSAQATRVTGETNMANNNQTDGKFVVRLKGDVSNDCKVDIVDLATVGSTFGKTQGAPGFNSSADLNNDATINIVDLVLVASNFGHTC